MSYVRAPTGPEEIARFSYAYDATGYFLWPTYLDAEQAERLGVELDRLGWADSEFSRTRRIDDLTAKSPLLHELAREIFDDPALSTAMTYPHRLIESYALDRQSGGSLPIHGGAAERLTRAGHPAAEDISCAYIVRSGRMYSFRTKLLMYLDRIEDDADGPLFYVEGSHKAHCPFVQTFAEGAERVEGHGALLRRIPVQPGTLLLLNEALLHGALEKTSPRRRRVIVFTFAPSFARDWLELPRGDAALQRAGYVVPDTEDSH